MAIKDIYSKRMRRQRGEMPDTFQYDEVPITLREQIWQLSKDYLGENVHDTVVEQSYGYIVKVLRREYGKARLNSFDNHFYFYELSAFLMNEPNAEKVLDVIELLFQMIEYRFRDESIQKMIFDEANFRFRENGIGYAYESSQIIRVDTTYTHAEIVKPTLSLLTKPVFSGANDEFLSAHEHYRHGNHKECLTDCLKAFESTMKTICTAKGWQYDPNRDTASKLLQICFTNGLVPAYLQTELTSLKTVLESGIPTLRNKTSGHGQGTTPTTVEEHVARYGLNMTGANILFLAEQSGL